MDCNAGAQLGRQFTKDAMMMHGGVPMQPGFADQPDMLMQAPPMAMGPGMAPQDWAQGFQQQNQAAAMRQQHEMEQAFRAQAAQQGQMASPTSMASPMQAQMQQAQMQQAQMMMGGALVSNVGFGMMMPRTQYQPTLNLGMQAQQSAQSVNLAAAGQDQEWANKLGQQQWGQDYANVQEFTVDGQKESTVAEKTKDSEFYQFMDRVKNREILIDEEKGEVVAGPGPEETVAEDAEYLKNWSAMEGLNMPDSVFREAPPAVPGVDEPTAEMAAEEADAEDWAKEYMEMQQRMDKAMNNTDYPFEPNNPYINHEGPYEEGMEMLKLGNLAEAALAFEAACQQNNEHFAAWRVLGTTQAENEKDSLAIIALNNARKLNPRDVSVHAALAVSHTNEHNTDAAMECLKQYLVNHPEYEQLGSISVPPPENMDPEMDEGFFFADPVRFNEVTTLYQAAIEMNPSDPQLFVNLGVLYSITHDFESAATNFRRAVELTPGDARLWNKLGATLANGSRGEEALAAYNRALDINPGYVRAMYNMGVAYNNLGKYMQSAKQIVRAIAVQQGDTNPTGEGSFVATRGMWELLRMALNLLDREDLVKLTYDQNLPALVKEFGLEGMV